jgi:hypothetical protein
MSTLGGWTIIICIAGFYAFRYSSDAQRQVIARTVQNKRIEDQSRTQAPKDNKDKAKRQRKETFSKKAEQSDKFQPQPQEGATKPLPAASRRQTDESSDDNVSNREFAKQLASIKQGTNFNGPKKTSEKKQKSVKQSRAQEKESFAEVAAKDTKASAPSSTTGAEGDDDESPIASPEVTPADAGDVSDMLERPSSTGPSVLRLTETDKVSTKKPKKPTEKQPVETKKQRQNRAKIEAAKLAREEAEADRKKKAEAQRRLARISEGRPAKDGSSFTAASQLKSNVWTGNSANGANGTSSSTPASNGDFVPVQPLDTFSSSNGTASNAGDESNTKKSSPAPVAAKADTWMSSLPSEEEQMAQLQNEDNWNTVPSKKARKKSRTAGDSNDNTSVNSSVTKPQQVVPVSNSPVMVGSSETRRPSATKPASSRPTKTFGQQSSFAALSNDDHTDSAQEEQEWDV